MQVTRLSGLLPGAICLHEQCFKQLTLPVLIGRPWALCVFIIIFYRRTERPFKRPQVNAACDWQVTLHATLGRLLCECKHSKAIVPLQFIAVLTQYMSVLLTLQSYMKSRKFET